ncbi:MAG: alpha/beta hydrolase [Planctomycetaceae bacterium]
MRVLYIVLVLSGCLASDSDALAQDEKEKKEPRVENKTLTTEDEWPIHITYYSPGGGDDTPVLVLLHMKGSNRQVYHEGLAEKLQLSGYAVITVDLRKHGESKSRGGALEGDDGAPTEGTDLKPLDYKLMATNDMEAVKKFIFSEHQNHNLNMSKMGIVAAEMSAPIAINYTALDWLKEPYDDAPSVDASTRRGQDIKALALLSPSASVPGLQTGKPLNQVRDPFLGISFMIGVGSGDPLDRGDAKTMYQKLSSIAKNKDRMYLETYKYKMRGTDLLGKNILVEDHITAFFDRHLKDLNIEWEDRRPRYDRKKDKK